MSRSPIPFPVEVDVREGPALLAGLSDGPGLARHRQRWGEPPRLTAEEVLAHLHTVDLPGRGGAGFPFRVKFETTRAGRRRPVVVVNFSEGEPASAKDHALATRRPHLVLDGATLVARALHSRTVHVVAPGDRPAVLDAVQRACAERPERFRLHVTQGGFVSGQARAVLELMGGRPNLPVSAWSPEAVSGHRGRPTLLSNAETWAQVGHLLLAGPGAYAGLGSAEEPGTTLLTVTGSRGAHIVVEVELGRPWRDVLPASVLAQPLLVGGFHGAWAPAWALETAPVSHAGMRALHLPLGAGVVLVPGAGECPVTLTAQVVGFLAGESAGRCGPCINGLPALAAAMAALARGTGGPRSLTRVHELTGLVTGRGACAHPDGTARLVRSVLTVFPDEVAAHVAGGCGHPARAVS